MAWTHVARDPISARWSCRRCYTVNAVGAQFCSDCGLTPRPVPIEAALPSSEPSARRFVALPFMFLAVVAIAFVGLQLVR
jgi:hypothetical protein